MLGLPKEKLYFTVFEDDDETIEIWKSLGVEDSISLAWVKMTTSGARPHRPVRPVL